MTRSDPMGLQDMRVEVDGREATDEQLRFPSFTYGHFTAMQVRAGGVRGLDLHLRRLNAANRELFGAAIDSDRVREHIRHAIGDDRPDASVRVYVASADGTGISIMITVRAPIELTGQPVNLRSVPYQRTLPHLKRITDFGQSYYGRLAAREGYDDALLTGTNGMIAECGVANIAFLEGASVVWPAAPVLEGITMQLLEPLLSSIGLPSRREPIRLSDLDRSSPRAFVTNARGVAPIGRIDDREMPAPDAMGAIKQVYGTVPFDPI